MSFALSTLGRLPCLRMKMGPTHFVSLFRRATRLRFSSVLSSPRASRISRHVIRYCLGDSGGGEEVDGWLLSQTRKSLSVSSALLAACRYFTSKGGSNPTIAPDLI